MRFLGATKSPITSVSHLSPPSYSHITSPVLSGSAGAKGPWDEPRAGASPEAALACGPSGPPGILGPPRQQGEEELRVSSPGFILPRSRGAAEAQHLPR